MIGRQIAKRKMAINSDKKLALTKSKNGSVEGGEQSRESSVINEGGEVEEQIDNKEMSKESFGQEVEEAISRSEPIQNNDEGGEE